MERCAGTSQVRQTSLYDTGWNDTDAEGVKVQSIYTFVSLTSLAYGAGNHYWELLEWTYIDSLRPLQSQDTELRSPRRIRLAVVGHVARLGLTRTRAMRLFVCVL